MGYNLNDDDGDGPVTDRKGPPSVRVTTTKYYHTENLISEDIGINAKRLVRCGSATFRTCRKQFGLSEPRSSS
jgi:hypothetical protein